MTMSETPVVLTEIETALLKLRQAKELIDSATEALVRSGAFVAWATQENRRLVRERDEAISDRHQARLGRDKELTRLR
jgi:hypothetical protein